MTREDLVIGKRYLHKKGAIITILAISQYTETPEGEPKEYLVIYDYVKNEKKQYNADGTPKTYARPLSMFLDGTKRFTPIEDVVVE